MSFLVPLGELVTKYYVEPTAGYYNLPITFVIPALQGTGSCLGMALSLLFHAKLHRDVFQSSTDSSKLQLPTGCAPDQDHRAMD
jgi:hypothetical protein